jgi:thiol-disulfide isomerase/thioredoxin
VILETRVFDALVSRTTTKTQDRAISAATTQQYLDSIIKVLNNSNDIKKNEIITSLTKDDNLGPHRNVAPYLIYRYKWLFTLDELREFVTYFDNEQTSYLGEIKEYINLMERTEVGQPYIDFTMDNVEGESITLSDLIGNNKLLMIDFWAAWCPDCRAENPNIVAVYNDFKDKGLDIISVSLDTDKMLGRKQSLMMICHGKIMSLS